MSATLASVTKGKRAELLVMAELLNEGFSVFQALSDTEGIDCGVLGPNGAFWPIQIKSRAEFGTGDQVTVWGSSAGLPTNMFIIIYDYTAKDYWIIATDVYVRSSFPKPRRWKDGSLGYSLALTTKNRSDLDKYKNKQGIEQLRKVVYG